MENLLELYAQPFNVDEPVVCFDERPYMLFSHVREPLPVRPGEVAREDYEYHREGLCQFLVAFCPGTGWRHAVIAPRRTRVEFCHAIRELVDVHFPGARTIHLVLDNLNTHRASAFYTVFPPEEARRLLRHIAFHDTPVHGSWLNMIELELSVLARECLNRRIPDLDMLQTEVAAWESARNDLNTTIHWQFSVDQARDKLKRLYPQELLR